MTLDHELTHHLTVPFAGPEADIPVSVWPERSGMSLDSRWRLGGGHNEFFNYATTPIELDPRIAEVKRQYTYATGIPVNTPQEANRALQWYKKLGRRGFTINSMARDPRLRALIIQRMLELVQNTPTRTNKIASVGLLLPGLLKHGELSCR